MRKRAVKFPQKNILQNTRLGKKKKKQNLISTTQNSQGHQKLRKYHRQEEPKGQDD